MELRRHGALCPTPYAMLQVSLFIFLQAAPPWQVTKKGKDVLWPSGPYPSPACTAYLTRFFVAVGPTRTALAWFIFRCKSHLISRSSSTLSA